jgi:tripartite-type tricarboxylate transporter receptor subunit TctC
VVPFSAGSATDSLARVLGERMAASLGQPIVVDNAPGASGMLGTQQVARAEPDGHTVLIGTNTTHAANTSLFKQVSYDPVADFAPVAKLGTTPLALVVNPAIPAATVRELVDHARAHPGELSFGAGSASSRLASEMFKTLAGVDVLYVPYQSNPPAMTDLLGGQISFMIADLATTLPHARAGKLKALGVSTAQRTALAPDLPTIAAAGVPGYELTAWFAAFAPARTPGPIIQKLHDAFAAALADPEATAALRGAGIEASPSTPEELRTFVVAETARWAAGIRAAGIEPE